VHGDLLWRADPGWLSRISGGLTFLVFVGFPSFVVASLGLDFLVQATRFPPPFRMSGEVLPIGAVSTLAVILFVIGIFRFTTPDR